jgi:hypothetical protein
MKTSFAEPQGTQLHQPGRPERQPAAREPERSGRPSPAVPLDDRRPRFPLPPDDGFPEWAACRGEN